MKMRSWRPTSAIWDLKETRDELLADADKVMQKASRENRDFSHQEQAYFDQLLGRDKDGVSCGEIAKLDRVIDEKEKEENEMKRQAAIKTAARSPEDLLRRTMGDTSYDDHPGGESSIYQPMARLKAFPNTNEGARDAYACGMWIRAANARGQNAAPDVEAEAYLDRLGWNPQAAQTEGTDKAGGFLVPAPMSRAIITIRENVGVARRLCDIVPLSSNTEDVPKRTGGLTVYYPGEGNTVTTSDLTFGRVNLVAKKRAVANQISSELSDDALINMTDRSIDEMGYALADKEDEEFINGDGTSTYGGENGLLNVLGSSGVFTAPVGESTWLLLSSVAMSQWKGTLKGKFFQRGLMAILCSSEFYFNVFDRIAAAAGGNTRQTLLEGGLFDLADAQWSGIPCFFSDKMPNTTAVSQVSALYGNFQRSCMLGDRTGVRIGMSMDYAFLDDVTTMLAVSRYDINIHEPGDDTDAGGFVGLKTAAT